MRERWNIFFGSYKSKILLKNLQKLTHHCSINHVKEKECFYFYANFEGVSIFFGSLLIAIWFAMDDLTRFHMGCTRWTTPVVARSGGVARRFWTEVVGVARGRSLRGRGSKCYNGNGSPHASNMFSSLNWFLFLSTRFCSLGFWSLI